MMKLGNKWEGQLVIPAWSAFRGQVLKQPEACAASRPAETIRSDVRHSLVLWFSVCVWHPPPPMVNRKWLVVSGKWSGKIFVFFFSFWFSFYSMFFLGFSGSLLSSSLSFFPLQSPCFSCSIFTVVTEVIVFTEVTVVTELNKGRGDKKPLNAIDGHNKFQEIRCERQDLQAHIYWN